MSNRERERNLKNPSVISAVYEKSTNPDERHKNTANKCHREINDENFLTAKPFIMRNDEFEKWFLLDGSGFACLRSFVCLPMFFSFPFLFRPLLTHL